MAATAIISDIHANLEALTAVMKDIREKGVTDIVCLGDLVGYGPDPAPVVDQAMEWRIVLMGNHDEAVVKFACGFNPVARKAVAWTRDQLEPGFFSGKTKKSRWEFLQKLPLTHTEGRVFYVHGSPRDPTMEYIFKSDTIDLTGDIPDKIRDIFGRFEHLCIVGHTHEPGIITDESVFLTPAEVGFRFIFEEQKKYVVNVGSVGQPRDRDTRASYAILDGRNIEFRRVTYDFHITAEKIFRSSHLDRHSGERLLRGQ